MRGRPALVTGALLTALVVPLLAYAGTISWGAPLAVIVTVLACAAVSGEPGSPAPLAWAFAGAGLLAALQAVPLPLPLLSLLSPGAARVWRAPPGWESGTLSLAPWDSVGLALLLAAAAALHVAAARVKRRQTSFHVWLVGIALAIGILAIAERVTPLSLWRDRQDPQGLGPFPNRNALAALCASALPLAAAGLASALRRETGVRPLSHAAPILETGVRPLSHGAPGLVGWGGAIAVLAAIIAGSGSRVGAAGAAAGLAVFTLVWRSPWESPRARALLRIGPLALVAFALALGLSRGVLPASLGFANEASVRASVWRSALRLFAMFPLSGSGLGSFASTIPLTGHDAGAGHPHHAESDALELLAEGGLVLLAIGAIPVWRWARALSSQAREGSTRAAASLGGAAALAIASLGTFTVTGSPALLLWAAVLTAGSEYAVFRAQERNTAYSDPARVVLLLPLLLLPAAGGRFGGALYFEAGRSEEGVLGSSAFTRAVRWDPRHPAASLELARLSAAEAFSSPTPWEETDALDAAAGWYLRRLAVRPTDPNARLGLASICDAAGPPGGNTLRSVAVGLRNTAVVMDKANPAVAPYGRTP